MDFEQVVTALLRGLEEAHIRYGVIGGFAVGALGVPRATMDLDLLIHAADLPQLDEAMRRLGYKRRARTENVSHYAHPEARWGAIDCLHAMRKYTLAMLERAQSRPIFGGTRTIKVLQVEDVIGLKVQGMANNPNRQGRERVDIEALMSVYRDRLDWNRIQEYYTIFDMEAEAERLRKQFGHAE